MSRNSPWKKKRWFKYLLLFGVLCLLFAAAGTRVSTGQGYFDPTLTGAVRLSSPNEANRALDVILTNRASGRAQKYGWPLLVSGTDGTVALHCHEWKKMSLFGLPVSGMPWNEFRRTVKIDESIRGDDSTYDYTITWRVRSPAQAPD
jgi:hypothetical protein